MGFVTGVKQGFQDELDKQQAKIEKLKQREEEIIDELADNYLATWLLDNPEPAVPLPTQEWDWRKK